MLQCVDGTFYTGITTDVDRRVREHNASPRGAKYTRARRPVRLVYQESFDNRSAASKAEAEMKTMTRKEKERVCYVAP